MDLIPSVVEPVPASLVPYLSGDHSTAWETTFRAWRETPPAQLNKQQFWDITDAASTWIGKRTLDTSYLSPSAKIRLWFDGQLVHLAWDNTLKICQGAPAWSALGGSAISQIVRGTGILDTIRNRRHINCSFANG
jgi:hypothetical protein